MKFGAEVEFGAGLIKPIAGFEVGIVSNPDIDIKAPDADGETKTAATVDANSFMRLAAFGGAKIEKKQDKLTYFGKGYLGFLLAGAKPEYNASVKISDTKSKASTIEGSGQQAVYLGLGAGIDYAISQAFSLFANMDTKINADIFDYQGNVGASLKF
jgi:outer membrane autotransporter protein